MWPVKLATVPLAQLTVYVCISISIVKVCMLSFCTYVVSHVKMISYFLIPSEVLLIVCCNASIIQYFWRKSIFSLCKQLKTGVELTLLGDCMSAAELAQQIFFKQAVICSADCCDQIIISWSTWCLILCNSLWE